MSFQPTEEQRAAIAARGKIIVSASAGSGKTAVMIERLVSLILNGASVREMLAVTYTRKAAAQMREKLRAALIDKIGTSGEAERERLKEQLAELPLADICTMHVFCARLIRTHFFLADVDPAFRIVGEDDAEGKTYSARAIDETFEAAYAAGDESLFSLLSVYFRKKNDGMLRQIVRDLYRAVRSRADYRAYLREMGNKDDFTELAQFLQSDFAERAQECFDYAEDCAAHYLETNPRAYRVCEGVIRAAESLLTARDLFEMAERASAPLAIPSMPPTTKATGEAYRRLKKLQATSQRIKKVYKELKEYSPRETEYARYEDARGRAKLLAALVLDYDERYTRFKREAGVLDYNDLEHYALAILQNDEARAAVRERYRYVFADEYQDVNLVQEKLLEAIGGEDVFFVGDAKQAIYAFRGSCSEYFLKKTRELPFSLKLSESFRSAPAVLEAVNRVFSYAMTEENGGIDYRNTARMAGGSRYGAYEGDVLFHRIPEREKGEKEVRGVYSVCKESAPAVSLQARLIADLIVRETQGATYFDADAGIARPVDYGDIAVLVRKRSGDAEKIVAELSNRNIPVTTTASVNVCDFWEARLLIDWLSFLDNREQDIPRAGAMLSLVGGFSEADLAVVRERFPSVYTFREACKEYREKMDDELSRRLADFEARVARYRTLMCVKSAAEVMNCLLADGLETEIAAKRDGETRLMRVRRLIGMAEGNVNAFLHRLNALEYNVPFCEGGGEHAVKVLTMHAAKGLEYPVVILASMDTPFHGADTDEVLYQEGFDFAPKSFDVEHKIVYPNLQRRACALQQKHEEVKGELNLLYVAMTRAKYRLHVVLKGKEEFVSPRYAKCFSDFLDLSDCAHYFAPEEGAGEPSLPVRAFAYRADPEWTEKIRSHYRQAYPYGESTALPVKSSATELLKAAKEEQPKSFSGRASGSSSIEEGVAYHTFLQHVVFGKEAGEEFERMKQSGEIDETHAVLIREEKLKAILRMPSLCDLADKRIWREQTFLLSLTAREAGLGESDDNIVLQGAIDLLVEDDNGYTVLDYKYSVRSDEELKRTYAPQIALYRQAVAKVMRVPPHKVRARILNIFSYREIEL